MVRHALAKSSYDDDKGIAELKAMVEALTRICAWATEEVAANRLQIDGDDLEGAMEVCFHLCNFDEAATKALVSSGPRMAGDVLDSAQRGCRHIRGGVAFELITPTPLEMTNLDRTESSVSLLNKLARGDSSCRSSITHSANKDQRAGTAGAAPGPEAELGRLLAMIRSLQHSSRSLASELALSRAYIAEGAASNEFTYDPRFLVFEYMSGFVLRKRQVDLINAFARDAVSAKSRVEQLIMGQGKTAVIGPMLALMLTSGDHLVTQVVPDALLEHSRQVMRGCFSSVITKRVYTLAFDRSSNASNDIVAIRKLGRKLEVARDQCGIVCTTPGAVKSLFLKFVDLLQSVEDANPLLRCPISEIGTQAEKAVEMGRELRDNAQKADALAVVLKMWGKAQNGIALLDEVDMLLHPLRSELNFPIGPKKPLESCEFRWDLPIHMLDGLFYPALRRISLEEFQPDPESSSILLDIASAIQHGISSLQVQTSPHLALLTKSFYEEHLKRPFARWAVVWLRGQQAMASAIADVLVRRNGGKDGANSPGGERTPGGGKVYERRVHELMTAYVTGDAMGDTMVQKWFEENHPKAMKMLNLARDWVTSFMAHVFSKVDRVGFGLLKDEDVLRWEVSEGKKCVMPNSRKLLAVPFVALEVPSRTSEFAHPEVLIGLTVLAFRYEGLRLDDLKTLVKALQEEMNAQAGPFSERPARVRFSEWVADARRSRDKEGIADIEVMELELLMSEDPGQMGNAMVMLAKHPPSIIYYLKRMVFPRVMKKQVVKLQASGVDLGGDMLFGTRLGFSGTPSDLLPDSLKPCYFEPGSEAQIIRQLTSSELVTSEVFRLNRERPDDAVDELLRHVANARQANGKCYSALIDTGALITGMSNEEVARRLLAHGLNYADACVFLDASDKKMAVDRTDGTPVGLTQCGISKEKRFCFYDQVHTLGMDIQHALDARAVVTLGKDMTLRDFAQGCYRMRGLANGQTLHLLIIDEVVELVQKVSNTGNLAVDVMAWLISQSMQAESLQYTMLVKQNLANLWRRAAFQRLLDSKSPPDGDQLIVAGDHIQFIKAVFGAQQATVITKLAVADPVYCEDDIINAEELEGMIAVVKRGKKIPYVQKALRVQAAGAVAMLVINNDAGKGEDGEKLHPMGPSPRDKSDGSKEAAAIKIPCVVIRESSGESVMAATGTDVTLILDGKRYPLQSRFWAPIPDNEVAATIRDRSLLTAEELEKIQKDKDNEVKLARIKMIFGRISSQLGGDVASDIRNQVQKLVNEEDFVKALEAAETFASGNGISIADDDPFEKEQVKLKKDIDSAMKQLLAAPLFAGDPTLRSDVVGGLAKLPLREKLTKIREQATTFGVELDLPSDHPDKEEEKQAEVTVEWRAGDQADLMIRSGNTTKTVTVSMDNVVLDMMPGSNSKVPIERLKVGEEVLAVDAKVSSTSYYLARVTKIDGDSFEVLHVTFEDGDSSTVGIDLVRLVVKPSDVVGGDVPGTPVIALLRTYSHEGRTGCKEFAPAVIQSSAPAPVVSDESFEVTVEVSIGNSGEAVLPELAADDVDDELAAAIAMSLEGTNATVRVRVVPTETVGSLIDKVRAASDLLVSETPLALEDLTSGAKLADMAATIASVGVANGHTLKVRPSTAEPTKLQPSTSAAEGREDTRKAFERSLTGTVDPTDDDLASAVSATPKVAASGTTVDGSVAEPVGTKSPRFSETKYRYRHNTTYGKWNIRLTPSPDGEVIHAVEQGAEFDMIERNEEWLRVSYQSRKRGVIEGWVLVAIGGDDFIVPVPLEYDAGNGEIASSADAAFLSMSIRLFKEPMDSSLLSKVPVFTPYSDTLEAMTNQKEHKSFLEDPDAAAAAKRIVDEVRAGEHAVATIATVGPADAPMLEDNKNLDSEVVQEQEQEQEQQQQQQQQKQQRADYARNPKDTDAWRLSMLAYPDRLIGASFHRAADFKVSATSQPLPYPQNLLFTVDYAPQLHRSDLARRLKNVEVVMRWVAPLPKQVCIELEEMSETAGEETSEVISAAAQAHASCVVVSLAEAETLRRYTQRRGAIARLEKVEVALCTVRGLWISDGTPLEPLGSVDEGTDFFEEKVAELYACLRQAGKDEGEAVEEAKARVKEEIAELKQAKVQDMRNLLERTYSSKTASKRASLSTQAHINAIHHGLLSFNTLRQAARFFNSEMWFDEHEIIALLRSLATVPESQRRSSFEETIGCRKRDMVSWEGTALQKVFSHSDHRHLLRMRDLSLQVRRAIASSGKSLAETFRAWDADGDNWLSQEELEKGLVSLKIGLAAEEVVELLRHADLNGDGFLNYREFAAEFTLRSAILGVSRVDRMLARRREDKVPINAAGQGILGLQGMAHARHMGGGEESSEAHASDPAGMDWRQLASLGKRFLTSGGHVRFLGDSRVSTRPGYCASLSPRGVILTSGKWYFEVLIISAGRGCVGWASPEHRGGCVGSGPHSWGYDGFSRVLRHSGREEAWGEEWASGDIIGCCADLVRGELQYCWNGAQIGDQGLAFSAAMGQGPRWNADFGLGVTPAVSFESSLQFSINFGESPFRNSPPPEYRSVHYWVREFVEKQHVMSNRGRLGKTCPTSGGANWEITEESPGVDNLKALRIPGQSHNFPSAILGGCLLTSGKWYYEFTVVSSEDTVWQNGWADLDFVGSQRDGFGVGDDKHSWAYDGCRAFSAGLWFNGSHNYGLEAKVGDIVGCEADLDNKRLSFSLNGSWAKPMGSCALLENIEFVVGLTPGFTLQAPCGIRVNLGGRPFRYCLRAGTSPVMAWINDRRARYINGVDPAALVQQLEKKLGDLDLADATEAEETEAVAASANSGPLTGLVLSDFNGSWSRSATPQNVRAKDGRWGFQPHEMKNTIVWDDAKKAFTSGEGVADMSRISETPAVIKWVSDDVDGNEVLWTKIPPQSRGQDSETLHQRRMLLAELHEAKTRADPATASEGTKLESPKAGGHETLHRSMTFTRTLSQRQQKVCLRASSGNMHVVLATEGEVYCTKHYPSVVGDVALPVGSWIFEVAVLEVDPGLPQVSAVVGWADSKRFFGDYVQEQGVGDGPQSWGVTVQDVRATGQGEGTSAMKRHAGKNDAFGLPIKQGSTVGCAAKVADGGKITILFGLDGKWDVPMGHAFVDAALASEHVSPAASLRSDAKLQFNFGERPFAHPVPEGFLPVQCYIAESVEPPAWLQYWVPPLPSPASPPATVVPAAAGQVMPLLLQQLSATLQLLQIEAARSGERDTVLDGMVHNMTVQMEKIVAHVAVVRSTPEVAKLGDDQDKDAKPSKGKGNDNNQKEDAVKPEGSGKGSDNAKLEQDLEKEQGKPEDLGEKEEVKLEDRKDKGPFKSDEEKTEAGDKPEEDKDKAHGSGTERDDSTDAATMSMKRKVEELIELATNVLEQSITAEKAEQILNEAGGSLDVAMGMLLASQH